MKVNYSGIRAEMARRGVKQQDLARKLGVHYNTINNWVWGRHDPGLGALLELLRAIGMGDDEILALQLGDLITIEEENEKAPAQGQG